MTAFSHETHGKANVFNRFADRHPYQGVLILFVILLVVSQGMTPLFGLVIASLFPVHRVPLSFLQNVALGEIPMVLLVVGLISVLGWWTDTGFTRWSSRQGLVVFLVPFALTGLKILYAPFGSLNVPLITAVTAVAFTLVVGFVEEGFFRGLLFRTLLPKGIVLSAIVSSVLFACFHLINLSAGMPWTYVASQLIFALGLGSLFVALRVRAISIWPPILLHALYDAPSLIMPGVNPNKIFDAASPLSLVVSGMMSLLCIAYAAYLLRPRQLARLSLVYGLQTNSGSDKTVESRQKRLRPDTIPSTSVEPTGADDVSDRLAPSPAAIPMRSGVPYFLPCEHTQRSTQARFCSVCGTPVVSSCSSASNQPT